MKKIVSVLFFCQLLILSIYGLHFFGHNTGQNILFRNSTNLVLYFNNQEEYNFFLNLIDEKDIPISILIYLDVIEDILYELENNIYHVDLFYVGGNYNIINILASFYRSNFIIITLLAIICILMFICIFTSIVQYSIFQLKYSSILLLNGYSKLKIILISTLKILKPLLGVALSCFFVFIIFAIYLGYSFYILRLSLYFITFSILILSLYALLANIFINFYLKKLTTIDILKGKKPYYFVQVCSLFLQLLFVVIFMWGVNYSLNNYKVLNNRIESLDHWDNARNIFTLRVANIGQESDFEIEVELTEKLIQFYEILSNNNNGFIINSRNYDNMSFLELTPEDMGVFPYGPHGYSVTISTNYLDFNPIIAVNSIPIQDQIIYDDYILNILVPISLINYRDEIALSFLEYFHFAKETVDNIYNTQFDLELTTIPIEDLSIHIIYVEDNQYYFAFDPYLHSNERSMIKDPVAIIYTENIHPSFLYSNFTHSVFMYADTFDIYNYMEPTLVELDLVSAISGFIPVYEQNARAISGIRQELFINTLLIIAMFLGNIIITYNLIANYFYRNKYKIFIKSLFGYSAFKRNNIFIIGLTMYIVLITLLTWFFIGKITLFLGVILLIKNFLLLISIEKILLNKSYGELMKGEN